MGMELFAGSYGDCDLSCAPFDAQIPEGARTAREGCLGAGGDWVTGDDNFDSILQAMMSVFVVRNHPLGSILLALRAGPDVLGVCCFRLGRQYTSRSAYETVSPSCRR